LTSPASRWHTVALSEVCEVAPKDAPLPADAPFVPMDAVTAGERWPSYYEARGTRSGVRAQAGDVLFARITPCLENGKVAQVPPGTKRIGGSTEFIVVRPGELVDEAYLYFWCMEPSVRAKAKALMAGATGRMRLGAADLRQFRIPLPSLDEQRRIVELLEGHLSRLDAADSYLKAGRLRLGTMKRVALASCKDGELQPLADVTEIQGGVQKRPKRAPKGNAYPFLRVANVTPRGLDLDDVHQIELFDGELDRLKLQVGDLLVVEGNGSASQIGRAAMWDGSIADCVHQNHLIRVRPMDGLLPEYLEAVWNSPENRARLTQVASSSSGLHTLSVSKLKRLSLPVPSIPRQRELVDEVVTVTDTAGRLGASIATATRRKESLRLSLLAAAFSGRLTAEVAAA
jgi:type I restriction enzyme, S subunit